MKFLTDEDAKLFLIELGQFEKAKSATKEYKSLEEEIQSLVKKRDGLVSHLKDHRKSQNAKEQWRNNRHKMVKGIKTYHRSTEGKRFHRNLGNFLATRLSGVRKKNESTQTKSELFELLKSLTSARTHLFIELEFYHPIFEQAGLEEFAFNYALPILSDIEEKVMNRVEPNHDEMLFLMDLVEQQTLERAFQEVANMATTEVEKLKEHLSLT